MLRMTGRINVALGNDARVILVIFLHYVLVTLAKRQTAMLFRLEDAACCAVWSVMCGTRWLYFPVCVLKAVVLCSLLMSYTLFSTTGWHPIIFLIPLSSGEELQYYRCVSSVGIYVIHFALQNVGF